MTDLILWTNPMSRGRIARWMMEEVGEPYEARILDYGPEMKAPDYLAVNPMGKVPALCHGGTVVTEAAAICAYMADAFPAAGLAPEPTSPERGAYYRWLFFAAGPLEAAVTNRALGFEVPEGRERTAGHGSMEDVLGALEGLLVDREFVTGRFSAADVHLGSAIGWGLMFGTLPERPGFRAYHERLSARSAAIRARKIDDALMEGADRPADA